MENHILTLLKRDQYTNAIRLAEIFHAEVNSDDSLYYVALCYSKSRKFNSAYRILSRASYLPSESRLLLGQCSFELDKYSEAERALLGNDIKIESISQNNLHASHIKTQLVKLYSNDSSAAATAAQYIGSICERTSRPKEAAEFYRVSIELFPFQWSSAEALARLTDKTLTCSSRTNILASALSKAKAVPEFGKHSVELKHLNQQLNHFTANSHIIISVNDKSTPEECRTPQTRRAMPQIRKEPRRSTRLYSIENNETPAARPIISGANAPAKKMRRAEPEIGLDSTAKVFLELYRALDCLYQYKLDLSISILNALPEKHRNTGWVLSCIGRAYYEKTNYTESVKHYEAARALEPYRLEGMEFYSSALWHLHKEVELSILARELMELDPDAPQTWCVAGNCYSLQKEHETAIKYLERAIKVDPNFVYAYTLLGHELISAERLDQATTYFRSAARLDPRHWNAWCGLGCIYYKNELYVNAEMYYKKALKIAPSNPVLMCQLAVVQHACKRSDAAIETLSRALSIDPDNALCRFHRATIYSAIDKNTEALAELDELKRLVPKESMVYFLIGKIHKKMGNTHIALMNFSWAMELDPKGANNTIRDVIDRQHSGEEDVVVHRDQCVDA